MATFRATFSKVATVSGVPGQVSQVFQLTGALGLDELTTSGTSQDVEDGAAAWTAPEDGVVYCRVDGGAVWVSSGVTAAVATGIYMADGERLPLGIKKGESLNVIDDS